MLSKYIWSSEANSNSLCIDYRLIKTDVCYEEYLDWLNYKDFITVCKFRCRNRKLPVNTGRFESIARLDRLRTSCDSDDVADKFHYHFRCILNELIGKGSNLFAQNYRNGINTLNMQQLFNKKDKNVLVALASLTRTIYS